MPARDTERPITLRRFDGVNLLLDQAFLGPSYLRKADNWIPGLTFRLDKTPGNTLFAPGAISTATRVLKLTRAYNAAGNRYLYAVVSVSGGGDQLWVSQDEGAWTQVQLSGGGNATFAQSDSVYEIENLNGILYVGNGIDPLYSIPIGSTATALVSITAFTDGSAAPSAAADPGAQILCGSYSFAWAIFDHTANVWLERGQTRTLQTSQTGDQSISFPTPTGFSSNGGALSTRYRAHLFIAPINLPVEFGHDHTPAGLSGAGTQVIRALVADGEPLPLIGPARTGRMMRGHLGRLWLAGDQSNLTAVWASSTLVPGLEQVVFNSGLFFPANARLPRTFSNITALGLAATGRDQPSVPLIICTLTDTYLFYGDIFDDPSAQWLRVSQTIGCVNKDTMVETPHGTLWMGLQSVYLMPPGGGVPIDVGWPIRPSIEETPVVGRAKCTAIYHKGFYKLAIVPPGQLTATKQWWLDLSQGIEQIPSWWGPNKRVAVSAWCVGQQDPAEPDRGFGAVDAAAGAIELLQQANTYSESNGAVPIPSTLQTGDLDDGHPFDRKVFTRVRVTAFPIDDVTIDVGVVVDGATVTAFDAMTIPGISGAEWDVGLWNVAEWAQETLISEGQSQAPSARPRGRSGAVILAHDDAVPLSLRDFELVYLPVERPDRTLPDDPLS